MVTQPKDQDLDATERAREVFMEIHTGLPREGPGNNTSTRRAYSILGDLPAEADILDIGCGPGIQTLELAKLSDGKITALDVRQEFLDVLNVKARVQYASEQITTVLGSMFEMPFEKTSFDLIWSEGAIYIMGFKSGLTVWRPFLKQNGFMAVTQISWLKPDVPKEPKSFWQTAYPEMTSVEENLALIEMHGFKNIDHFTLPEAAWWDDYYIPLEERLSLLEEKYGVDQVAMAQINEQLEEIALYRKYSEYYGYVFYLMQRIALPGE